MEEAKYWWQSKTAWVNILVGGLAVMFPDLLGEVMTEANLVMIISVVNLVLRLVTKDAIAKQIF